MKPKLLAAAMLAIVPAPAARAQSALLVADTYVSTDATEANYGGQERLAVDATRRAVVQFALPAVPRGQTLRSAILTLYASQVVRPGAIGAAMLTARWSESAVNGRTLPASSTRRVTNVPVQASHSYVAIDVTAFVQAWIEGTPNHGLLIFAETAATSVIFDTKENAATSHPPHLELSCAAGDSSSGPPGPRGPAGPKGDAGPPGPGAILEWTETGRVMDARRIAQRRWGKPPRGPVQQIPLVYSIATPAGQPTVQAAGIETDGDSVYVLLSTQLSKYRARDGALAWSQQVSGAPSFLPSPGATLLHDGGLLWRLQQGGLIRVLPESGNQSAALTQSGNLWRLAFDGNHLWIAGSNGVRRLKASAGSIYETQAVEAENADIGAVTELAWDGEHMWAAAPAEGAIVQVTPTAQAAAKHTVCPPGGPMPGMVFDGTAVWVSCGDEGMLARWNTGRDGKPEGLTKVDAGGRIGMLEFDGAGVWAIRTGGGTQPSFVRVTKAGAAVEAIHWPGLSEPVLLRFDGENMWALMKVTTPGAPSGALVKF